MPSPIQAALMPRGMRNNNPGNMDKGPKWAGLAAVQSDSRFCTFISMAYGVRALIDQLVIYETIHGLKTVASKINRWAPPVENATSAYQLAVASFVGHIFDPVKYPSQILDEPISVRNPWVAAAMARGIIAQENGKVPRSWPSYPQWVANDVIEAAVKLTLG